MGLLYLLSLSLGLSEAVRGSLRSELSFSAVHVLASICMFPASMGYAYGGMMLEPGVSMSHDQYLRCEVGESSVSL